MAFGNQTFQGIGGAVNAIYTGMADEKRADALRDKGQGDLIEQGMYTRAAGFARLNEDLDVSNTAIQETQAQRAIFLGQGQATADIEGSGFQAGKGSAGDIYRSEVESAALTTNTIAQQGLITKAGHEEQASSYDAMSQAAGFAYDADMKSADAMDTAAQGQYIMGGISALSAVATLF